MPTLTELIAQKATLDKQITAARQKETGDAIARVRAIVEEFELSASDIFGQGKAKKAAKTKSGKVAPKYQDPATGATWTGRGIAPKWVAGKNKADFLIA